MSNIAEVKVKVFKHDDFGVLKTVMIDDAVWFIAEDAMKSLGYDNIGLAPYVDIEDTIFHTVLDSGHVYKTIIINKRGLDSLMENSDMLLEVLDYNEWVTSIVIPYSERDNIELKKNAETVELESNVEDSRTFNHPEFGNLRTVMIDGEPWFVAKDVAEALGYSNPHKAIRDHVFEEDKRTERIVHPSGGAQKTITINESGLYSLILSSKLPGAERYQDWIYNMIQGLSKEISTIEEPATIDNMPSHNEDVEIFNHPEFGGLRTITINGEPWFVGKDVAEGLGYSDTNKALRQHVRDSNKLTRQIVGSGQRRNMIIINEGGLYSLIMKSTLPAADDFQIWVTEDILPTIRKTGSYELQPKSLEEQALDVIGSLMERVKDQNKLIEEQEKKIALDAPKVSYYDIVLAADNAVTITTIAKDYGWSGAKMNKKLHELGIQYKQSGTWFLYQHHAGKGYTNSETYIYEERGNFPKARVSTKWTQKGRLFIYECLKQEGILPLVEQN